MSTRLLTFKEAIREAQEICLQEKSVILIGEGVPDPKAIFGTTAGLKDKFPIQVFDSPLSENGVTGICVGAAISGLRPILVHQRIDFSLYSADQIINVAAKWFSMFGGQKSVPLVIRMIVGRGWGQGNQHSQNLTSLYAHVPGLKIVVPSNAYNAKGLLIAAVRDPNPVLFIEHRWLYDTTSHVPEGSYEIPIGEAREITVEESHAYRYKSPTVTVVSSGHATREVEFAARYLFDKYKIKIDHVVLLTIKPLNMPAVKSSLKISKRLVVVDDSWRFGGLAAEIIAQVAEDPSIDLLKRPARITYPDFPSASSPYLTKNYYPGPYDIAKVIVQQLESDIDLSELLSYQDSRTHDVPDQNFRGPF